MRPADFVDPFKGRPGVFHLASDHLDTLRLFSDRESFRYGVNTLALAVARFGIRLFCYELMDSHLHVLVGGVLNRSFVDYTYVERQYGDSLKFFDVLRVWDLESAVALSHGVSEQVTFSDAELATRLNQLCRAEYGADSVLLLDRKSLLLLARTASRRFGVGKNQLARLLNLSADMLGKVL